MDETERSEDTRPGKLAMRVALRALLPGSNARLFLEDKVVIGRGSACSYRIEVSKVSRRHAEIYRQGPVFALRDLGSTNGTFVDGRRVDHCALRPSSVVRIGDWLGIVESLHMDELATSFGELAPGLLGGVELAREFEPLARIAHTDLPIVLVGETGTGKERFAEAVHTASGRAGPFHAVNCAALPSELAEGELFGYRRGAFTGADREHIGHFRASDGGTLFLDEIAELPLPLQAKLLRALETNEVTPLGDTRPVRVDARIVAALQKPLSQIVSDGTFREDLARRLEGMTVAIPPLRHRRGDIPDLFRAFLREYSDKKPPPLVTAKLIESLCLHTWPGNVRELRLLARRLSAARGKESVLRRSHLPATFRHEGVLDESYERPVRQESRGDHDRRRFEKALGDAGGNVTVAAEKAGISRQRAYRLMSNTKP